MLACLLASLSVTPIRRLTGWNEIVKLRRMLGLFAFFYGVLHMLTWIVFVHYFDVGFMVEDVVKRPFITIGMAHLSDPARPRGDVEPLCRSASWAGAGRRCTGWCTWRRSAACCTSGGWCKADTTEPLRWAAGLSVLLGLRVWWAWRKRRPLRS